MPDPVRRPPPATTRRRRVVHLLLPEVQLLDVAGPAQVFDTAIRLFGAPYEQVYCAAQGEVRTTQGLHLARLELLPAVTADDLVLVPGTGAPPRRSRRLLDATTRQWLQAAHRDGTHIASICSGTAVLGEAGLLEGRRCTTHWEFITDLQACYPSSRVVDGVLFVHDRGITTSAGVTAGIDMALWLLERDGGPRLAADVARQLVVYLRRAGEDRQISVHLEHRAHLDARVHRVQDWLAQHVGETVTMPTLAAVAQTSLRSLTRAFKAATGITPHEYHQRLRLEMAGRLLRESTLPLKTIAARTGFLDARHLRRLWVERFGQPPSLARDEAPARHARDAPSRSAGRNGRRPASQDVARDR